MNSFLEIFLRTLIAIASLLILTRITGAKQISQLTFYDYVTGITIGSIAGAAAVDTSIGILEAVLAIAVFSAVTFFIDVVTTKSIVLRRILTGKPIVLMAEGNILFKGLRRSRFDLCDMLRELRNLGYFNLSEINSIVLETNGKLSVQPKAMFQTATASDLNLNPPETSLVANAILDGKILEGNLSAMNKNKTWILEELGKQGIENIKDIAVALLTADGNLSVYFKNLNNETRTILD